MKGFNLSFRFLPAFILAAAFLLSADLSAQCISGNCQNGKGTFKYSNNSKYTGQFMSGRQHGSGKMTFGNGNVYDGQFVNGKMEGTGTMTYPNGDRYTGLWSKDQPNGKGVYYFVTKERYDGARDRELSAESHSLQSPSPQLASVQLGLLQKTVALPPWVGHYP